MNRNFKAIFLLVLILPMINPFWREEQRWLNGNPSTPEPITVAGEDLAANESITTFSSSGFSESSLEEITVS